MPEFCIYCLRKGNEKMSKAHVFSDVIGGRVWLDCVCADCNSVIGQKIESQIKQSLFFAFALDKLGLQPRDEAFRHIKIVDSKTGDRLRFIKGKLCELPRPIMSEGPIADSNFNEEGLLKWIKQNEPDFIDSAREQIRSGASRIQVGRYKFRLTKTTVDRQVEFRAGLRFPMGLLAKIALEAMIGFGFPTNDGVDQFYRHTFIVATKDGRTSNISISDLFAKRVQCFHESVLKGDQPFEELDYRPFHRVDFRVALSGIAYLKINFFEVVSFVVSICDLGEDEILDTSLLGKRFLLPISEHSVYQEELLEEHQSHRDIEDSAATARWNVFAEALKGVQNDEHE